MNGIKHSTTLHQSYTHTCVWFYKTSPYDSWDSHNGENWDYCYSGRWRQQIPWKCWLLATTLLYINWTDPFLQHSRQLFVLSFNGHQSIQIQHVQLLRPFLFLQTAGKFLWGNSINLCYLPIFILTLQKPTNHGDRCCEHDSIDECHSSHDFQLRRGLGQHPLTETAQFHSFLKNKF